MVYSFISSLKLLHFHPHSSLPIVKLYQRHATRYNTILTPPYEIRPINMCNTTIYLSRGFDPLHKTQEAQDPRKEETQG